MGEGNGEHRKKWYRFAWEQKLLIAGVEGELADMKVLRGGYVVEVEVLDSCTWLDEWSCKFNLRLTKFLQDDIVTCWCDLL